MQKNRNMSDTIKIKNIKGIKEFSYTLPNKPGVYLLTGENGTGKTTLLTALNRLGNHRAFANEFSNDQTTSKQYSIEFIINDKTVTYQKKEKRWTPTPRTQSKLINEYKYHQTYYLTATGLRLYQQNTIKLSKKEYDVDQDIVDAMNNIFKTNRFCNLKYIKVKSKKGRQKQLHRNNKLYVLKSSPGVKYSELDFSLGEKMVLNALDYISTIQNTSMLLIDEIELALHPIAQVNFFEHLQKKSIEKDLVIIISTHSATLIKQARNLQYLENNQGKITMVDNIKPAYILKDLSIEIDNRPDYLFFVEDIMAKEYLTEVIDKLRTQIEELKGICIMVVPVGGYEQVLTLMTYFYGVNPFSAKNVHSFLDYDVQTIRDRLQAKPNRTDAENRIHDLFTKNHNNYNFLSITPELGFWEEIINNKDWFINAFKEKYNFLLFDLSQLIDITNKEELATNPRSRAKNCLKNIHDKILQFIPSLDKKEFDRFIVNAYIEQKIKNTNFLNTAKKKIIPILQRV